MCRTIPWTRGMSGICSDVGSITDLDKDEEDCCDSDVADLEWDTWADACSFAFRNTVGAFPPGRS